MNLLHYGVFLRVVPDCKGHPVLVRVEDFEVLSGMIPSNWCYNRVSPNCVTLSPKDWVNLDNWEEAFWGDWDNCNDKAIESYNKEISIIRELEKETMGKYNLKILDDGEIVDNI